MANDNVAHTTTRRRLVALAALAVLVIAIVLTMLLLVRNATSLIVAVIMLPIVTITGFRGLITPGHKKWLYLILAGLAAVLLFYLLSITSSVTAWQIVIVIALVIAFWLLADAALPEDIRFFDREIDIDNRPKNPALIMNRWSGGGKVEQFDIEAKAKAMGIKTIMLERGDDLAQLARDAIADGADALGMAGGDGSLGLVAGIAAAHDVPFVCIPAGTRNHFGRDMGLDRADPAKALASFTGHEVRVDYALVGERVFVNNISLGLYASAVQKPEYRDNKLGTIAGMMSDRSQAFDLHFDGPNGKRYDTAQMLLISNNPYTLTDKLFDMGKRYTVDSGKLGIAGLSVTSQTELDSFVALATVGRPQKHPGWLEWTAETFTVEAEGGAIEAGVDGEALVWPSPMVCRIVPGGLRLLLPEGVEPGARRTPGMFDRTTIARLWRVARTGAVA